VANVVDMKGSIVNKSQLKWLDEVGFGWWGLFGRVLKVL